MDLELTGKRAIVTGGSRGIGKVIAQASTWRSWRAAASSSTLRRAP
jgi:NAD(P)-dependent dehydrogenase (short-subunit alcohol dehydrogenase family)